MVAVHSQDESDGREGVDRDLGRAAALGEAVLDPVLDHARDHDLKPGEQGDGNGEGAREQSDPGSAHTIEQCSEAGTLAAQATQAGALAAEPWWSARRERWPSG